MAVVGEVKTARAVKMYCSCNTSDLFGMALIIIESCNGLDWKGP